MDIDTVQDIMEEISEQYDIGNQIGESISKQNPLNIDESELLAELEELNEETLKIEARKLPPKINEQISIEEEEDVIVHVRSKEKKGKLI
uniref:Uncharacterized protein n=1 Tax=Panagrolaimus sp. PS1159 TaxID=55785 RepID=A0AC35GCB9_9BILA